MCNNRIFFIYNQLSLGMTDIPCHICYIHSEFIQPVLCKCLHTFFFCITRLIPAFCFPFCDFCFFLFPIEAALIAKNRAPGLDRRFAAQKWQSLPAKLWLDAAEEAMDQEFHGQYDIWGGDIDPSAVELSRHNAELAGVDDCVRFEVADAGKFHRDSDYGQLVTNPPYGERLLEKREAEALYRSFGKAARTLPAGWRVLVLSSHTEFERAFGRSAEKKRKLYNGMLKCDAFFYHGGAKTEPDKG